MVLVSCPTGIPPVMYIGSELALSEGGNVVCCTPGVLPNIRKGSVVRAAIGIQNKTYQIALG